MAPLISSARAQVSSGLTLHDNDTLTVLGGGLAVSTTASGFFITAVVSSAVPTVSTALAGQGTMRRSRRGTAIATSVGEIASRMSSAACEPAPSSLAGEQRVFSSGVAAGRSSAAAS